VRGRFGNETPAVNGAHDSDESVMTVMAVYRTRHPQPDDDDDDDDDDDRHDVAAMT